MRFTLDGAKMTAAVIGAAGGAIACGALAVMSLIIFGGSYTLFAASLASMAGAIGCANWATKMMLDAHEKDVISDWSYQHEQDRAALVPQARVVLPNDVNSRIDDMMQALETMRHAAALAVQLGVAISDEMDKLGLSWKEMNDELDAKRYEADKLPEIVALVQRRHKEGPEAYAPRKHRDTIVDFPVDPPMNERPVYPAV